MRMRNDIDVIRAILVDVRDRQDLWPRPVSLSGYDDLVVARHCERLFEDGLLDGYLCPLLGEQFVQIDVRDLTSAGHNFLAALETDGVWARLKANLKPAEMAALPLKRLAGVATDLAERVVRDTLGLN